MNGTFSPTLHKNISNEKKTTTKKKKNMRTETGKWKSDNGICD